MQVALFSSDEIQTLAALSTSIRIFLNPQLYSVMQIVTAKTTTLRTLYVHTVLKNAIFQQNLYDIVFLLDTFYLLSVSPSITLIKYVSSYLEM